MNIFFAVVEGDPLDSGGYVLEGGGVGTIKGEDGRHRRVTYLGQQAWCSTCQSTGTIEAAPGSPCEKRMRDLTSSGRRQALGGDWVRCRCERAPRIISVNGRKWKIHDRGNGTATQAASVPDRNSAKTTALVYDERFALLDTAGSALTDVAYAVRRGSGAFEYGRTDGRGRTHLLAPTRHIEDIHIYLVE
jgi:hypothetical protein